MKISHICPLFHDFVRICTIICTNLYNILYKYVQSIRIRCSLYGLIVVSYLIHIVYVSKSTQDVVCLQPVVILPHNLYVVNLPQYNLYVVFFTPISVISEIGPLFYPERVYFAKNSSFLRLYLAKMRMLYPLRYEKVFAFYINKTIRCRIKDLCKRKYLFI